MKRAALITGGSRGIGRAIAVSLSALGYDLLLNFRSDAGAVAATCEACLQAASARGHTISVHKIQGNVADASDRADILREARKVFASLDLLVNNAGMAPRERSDLLDTTEKSFDEVLSTNLKGPFFLTQAVARWMVEVRPEVRNEYQPKIVNISSVSAYTASINRGEYCVSKAGVSMLTALFAARLASEGIQVFEIRPGIIATDMTAGVRTKYDELIAHGLTPIQRWGQPEDVAKAVCAIAQDLLPFSTGEVINVDGGFHLRRL